MRNTPFLVSGTFIECDSRYMRLGRRGAGFSMYPGILYSFKSMVQNFFNLEHLERIKPMIYIRQSEIGRNSVYYWNQRRERVQ